MNQPHTLGPVLPLAGEAANADLVPAVARLLGFDESLPSGHEPVVPAQLLAGNGVLPRGPRGVVVVLVDGLGWHQLLADGVSAPLLRSAAAGQHPVRAVLPSTTASNLVSLGTGLAAGAHGVLGYTMLLDHDGRPAVFNCLGWRFGLRGGGFDARDAVVPEELVTGPTMFERLDDTGIDVSVVVHPDFLDSGLTRAGLRGGRRVAAAGIDATLATAVDSVVGATGPALAYCHHPMVDTYGHVDGPFTPRWHAAVRDVDDGLRGVLARLPEDVALVVTSDHGMVAVPDDEALEVDDDHPLLDGVAVVAGEPRMRTLLVDNGVDVDVVAERWRDAVGDRATVVATADAVAAGWFGSTVPDAHARRLGDVVVASHRGSVAHARVDPSGGRLAGLHGSITAAERDVPALVLTHDHA